MKKFIKTMATVIGIVLVWRGIWTLLDKIDVLLFGGIHTWTAIGGIVAGLFLLYVYDGDFKEIEKL
ncbi:MAG: hypothetical protein KBC22_02875 [Candidatus Pacebacteria bacterium]|nr:hypothetical protein [Candidatus Paceibacterota bacterium]